ncbi:YrhC family protein [Virgibacillus sp. DJP39]|uniref:YrhC family protein n=1 Tax=Virgibacillus sp. DJP39 TaxID=3409790 RepID=UPI003BB57F51
MHNKQKYLENKRKDYHSFIQTLFILTIYFYIGFVIDIYERPLTNHTDILTVLLLSSLTVLTFSIVKYNHIKQQLEEDNQA